MTTKQKHRQLEALRQQRAKEFARIVEHFTAWCQANRDRQLQIQNVAIMTK